MNDVQKTYSQEAILNLVTQFNNQRLPKEQWTHEAHLIMAIHSNLSYAFDEALRRVRQGIITYNEAVGTANTDQSGYHETLTIFWMAITRNFIQAHPMEPITMLVNNFLAAPEAKTTIVYDFYSKSVLFSTKARREWVGGDVRIVPLVDKGHGAWNATVDGKSLAEMSFDFIVERQNLSVE